MTLHDAEGLHVEVRGDGEPTVVLVHAGITDRTLWDREFAALGERGRVVRYDVRGFGRSADPDGDYFDHDDLLGVMDAVGARRAVLVGASNGGRIVLDTAVSAPDRVLGLVLVGSALPGTPMSPELDARFDAEDAALAAGDIARAHEINMGLWIDGTGRGPGDVAADVRRRAAAWLAAVLPRQADQIARQAGDAGLLSPPVRGRLGDITVPTLIIVGAHDIPYTRLAAQDLARLIPHSRLTVVDGAAHLVNVEQPDAFARALEEFLAQFAA